VVTAALARGVHIQGLGGYWATAGPAALLFGYGKLSPPTIHDSVSLLADVIKRLRPARPPSDAAGTKGCREPTVQTVG
jgi:DNA-binding transcriptional MocR family regulator